MEEKAKFLEKLSELAALAKKQGNQITTEEVKEYFFESGLTEEQMELVFDYLLTQKVVVKGYVKMDKPEAQVRYTEEEKTYLREYSKDLEAFLAAGEGEKEVLFDKILRGDETAKNRLTEIYLKEVVKLAKEMYHPEIFLGDMIQEGNVGLLLGMDRITSVETAHATILEQVRQSMQILIEEQTEQKSRDKKMVEKVSTLDESIKNLTEELGRKVTIDELAVYMGMTEEDVEDILRLVGEDTEEED